MQPQKISNDLAIAIYILSHLDLIDSTVVNSLPVSQASVSAIKAKRKWSHKISDDIDFLLQLCKKAGEKKAKIALENALRIQQEESDRYVKKIKNDFKTKVNELLSRLFIILCQLNFTNALRLLATDPVN